MRCALLVVCEFANSRSFCQLLYTCWACKWLLKATNDLTSYVHFQLVVGYSHNWSSNICLPLLLLVINQMCWFLRLFYRCLPLLKNICSFVSHMVQWIIHSCHCESWSSRQNNLMPIIIALIVNFQLIIVYQIVDT